mmetsp:Transcript_57405/g.124752  ORF Transcript_57405/g.124752 Transcript_57405/m.124752 type:complete len:88 (-) Transcript_57405:25-288(-)
MTYARVSADRSVSRVVRSARLQPRLVQLRSCLARFPFPLRTAIFRPIWIVLRSILPFATAESTVAASSKRSYTPATSPVMAHCCADS